MTKRMNKPPPKPIYPDEIVKINPLADEDVRQRKAFSLWEIYRDKGMNTTQADEAVANVVKVSKVTISTWKRKYGWGERYEKKLLNIYQKTALANLPALKQIACTTLEAMSASEVALKAQLERFYDEMKEYNETMEGIKSGAIQLKKKDIPAIPKPPFPIKSLDDLEKFHKVFQQYSSNVKGDDEDDLTKQLEQLSVGEIMTMVNALQQHESKKREEETDIQLVDEEMADGEEEEKTDE